MRGFTVGVVYAETDSGSAEADFVSLEVESVKKFMHQIIEICTSFSVKSAIKRTF